MLSSVVWICWHLSETAQAMEMGADAFVNQLPRSPKTRNPAACGSNYFIGLATESGPPYLLAGRFRIELAAVPSSPANGTITDWFKFYCTGNP